MSEKRFCLKNEGNVAKPVSELSLISCFLLLAGTVIGAYVFYPLYAISLLFLLAAFVTGILAIFIDRKSKRFVWLAILVVVIQLIFIGFIFMMALSFETTRDAFNRLSKIPEIEEFVITYDQDDDDDGAAKNDYEIYLTDNRFVKVKRLDPAMKSAFFRLMALGNYEIVVDGKSNEADGLSFSDLTALCGKKIKNFKDVVVNYDLIQEKLSSNSFINGKWGRKEFSLGHLDASKLMIPQKEFERDFLSYDSIDSFEKTGSYQNYTRYYKYHFKMKDGSEFEMTLSSVSQVDGKWKCDFSIVTYNGNKVKKNLNDWNLSRELDIEMNSYRDLFENYEKVKSLLDFTILSL